MLFRNTRYKGRKKKSKNCIYLFIIAVKETFAPHLCVASSSCCGVDSAFCREALWEALGVSAVIVYHVILLHPLQSFLVCCIQLFVKPCIAVVCRWIRVARR